MEEIKNTISYHLNTGSIIAEKETARDLGVLMSKDSTFKTHIKNVADAAKKMCGWILELPGYKKSVPVVEITSPVKTGLLQSALVSIREGRYANS